MATGKLLIVGGGGREHALAWKLAQSPRVAHIYVAPGNGGTATAGNGVSNLPLSAGDQAGLAAFAREEGIDLTVVGPEVPLAEGLVDVFQSAGLRCFGPSRAAAQIEASKDVAKGLMDRHGIPTARYAVFTQHDEALTRLRQVDYPVVVKAAGLAAGKGVIVPESQHEAEEALWRVMVDRAFGAAGDRVVIEERLYGQEASVLAFSDGRTVALMPPAQDHKPVFDGDRGPNTGGMGVYAPAPLVTPALLAEVERTVLRPVVDGMRAEGTPFVGVLYAGLMLTEAGPKVLEFNCRFGDPETQVILPLLACDLMDVLEACLDGTLQPADVRWHEGAAATVVAASQGYPGSYAKGRVIQGVAEAETQPGVAVFHAGTRLDADGQLLTDGGRVLAVTCQARDLRQAIDGAYAALGHIHFDGMHYRRDIGAKALAI